MPWNQHTLSGWIGVTTFCFFSSGNYMIVNGAFLSFFIVICVHHRAFYHYFDKLLQKLNKIELEQQKNVLRDIIQFHVSAKE